MFQISHFYVSFSNDTMAVKGLIVYLCVQTFVTILFLAFVLVLVLVLCTLVKFLYLVLARQVRVIVGDSGPCACDVFRARINSRC